MLFPSHPLAVESWVVVVAGSGEREREREVLAFICREGGREGGAGGTGREEEEGERGRLFSYAAPEERIPSVSLPPCFGHGTHGQETTIGVLVLFLWCRPRPSDLAIADECSFVPDDD